ANRSSGGRHEGTGIDEAGKWEEYLLRGELRCGGFGSVLVGTFKNGRRNYFHVWSEIKDADCIRGVHATKVENATMFRIGEALRNEKDLVREVEAQLGSQRSRIAEVE